MDVIATSDSDAVPSRLAYGTLSKVSSSPDSRVRNTPSAAAAATAERGGAPVGGELLHRSPHIARRDPAHRVPVPAQLLRTRPVRRYGDGGPAPRPDSARRTRPAPPRPTGSWCSRCHRAYPGACIAGSGRPCGTPAAAAVYSAAISASSRDSDQPFAAARGAGRRSAPAVLDQRPAARTPSPGVVGVRSVRAALGVPGPAEPLPRPVPQQVQPLEPRPQPLPVHPEVDQRGDLVHPGPVQRGSRTAATLSGVPIRARRSQ
ncbi:hypothetical protein SBADM41S_11848 [Streptomyces badius]